MKDRIYRCPHWESCEAILCSHHEPHKLTDDCRSIDGIRCPDCVMILTDFISKKEMEI